MEEFAFAAPTYLDFNAIDPDKDYQSGDSYFELDHEAVPKKVAATKAVVNDQKQKPSQKPNIAKMEDPEVKDLRSAMRRSVSMSCIPPKTRNNSTSSETSTMSHKLKKAPSKNLYGSKDTLIQKKNRKYGSADTMGRPPSPKLKPRFVPLQLTKPQSPNLMTRVRSKVKTDKPLSTVEREVMEFTEAQKIVFKSKPLNKKMFNGPVKPVHIVKKPSTVIEPFNLTETGKKKEEYIKKVLDDEKKMREFHSRPIPKSILASPKVKVKPIVRGNSMENLHSNSYEKTNGYFKAKPPTVLHKEPFRPKKHDKPLAEITAFQLNTDKRAKERQEYDEKRKENRELVEELIRIKQIEDEIREKQEIAKMRKEIVHHAQPIRKFKPASPITPRPLTDPVTPKVLVRRQLIDSKENCV